MQQCLDWCYQIIIFISFLSINFSNVTKFHISLFIYPKFYEMIILALLSGTFDLKRAEQYEHGLEYVRFCWFLCWRCLQIYDDQHDWFVLFVLCNYVIFDIISISVTLFCFLKYFACMDCLLLINLTLSLPFCYVIPAIATSRVSKKLIC